MTDISTTYHVPERARWCVSCWPVRLLMDGLSHASRTGHRVRRLTAGERIVWHLKGQAALVAEYQQNYTREAEALPGLQSEPASERVRSQYTFTFGQYYGKTVQEVYASEEGKAYINGFICSPQFRMESLPLLEMELRAVGALVPHCTHVSASPCGQERPSPDEVVSQSGVVPRQRSTARLYVAFFTKRFHVTLISES